jgi:putative restriction endonuclease
MIGEQVISENARRRGLWESLIAAGGPQDSPPGLLRELGIYGGAQGVWVDKRITGSASPNGSGIAVGLLHNGSTYDDDLSDDGVIYHFPDTNRPGERDASETAAVRNAFGLKLPVFVITRTPSNSAHRDVHLGWVVDMDEIAAQCLVEFGEDLRPTALAPTASEFKLEASRKELAQLTRRLKRSPKFVFEVGKRCGWRCAVCAIDLKPLLDAAHIRGVADKGSDDPRNGLILCKNHHAAFDANLLSFQPETGAVVVRDGVSVEQLGIDVFVLKDEIRPHTDALRWRWDQIK